MSRPFSLPEHCEQPHVVGAVYAKSFLAKVNGPNEPVHHKDFLKAMQHVAGRATAQKLINTQELA